MAEWIRVQSLFNVWSRVPVRPTIISMWASCFLFCKFELFVKNKTLQKTTRHGKQYQWRFVYVQKYDYKSKIHFLSHLLCHFWRKHLICFSHFCVQGNTRKTTSASRCHMFIFCFFSRIYLQTQHLKLYARHSLGKHNRKTRLFLYCFQPSCSQTIGFEEAGKSQIQNWLVFNNRLIAIMTQEHDD